MEPLTIILTLAGLASNALANKAFEDGYDALKRKLLKRWQGHPEGPNAETALAEYEKDPETWKAPLAKFLRQFEVDLDEDLVREAEQLLSLLKVLSLPTAGARWRDLNYLKGLADSRLNSMFIDEKASAHSEFFQKYVWQVYVKREGADEAFDRFLYQENDEKRCFLVTGKAGKGKTNLLCHFASTFTSRPGLHVPVLLSANELKLSERDLRSAVVQRLFETERSFADLDFLELAGFITSQGGNLIVFLDALNELEGTDVFRRFSDQLEHLIRDCRERGHRVLFCLSCRTELWPHFKSSHWAQNSILPGSRALSSAEPTLELGDFHEDDIDQISEGYFHWYAIKAKLEGSARRGCCDPLRLRYLCAAYTPRGPNDKKTPPDQLPPYELGRIRTLRLKEAFDSFVKNRREAMLKAARPALRNDDERLTYRYTTLYLITMAYRMYQKRQVSLEIGEVIEIARDLGHPDRLLAERGEEYFLTDPESVFFRLIDEGIILNKYDQRKIAFTFEAYFEYSLGRYFALERWPQMMRGQTNEDLVIEDFSELLREHRELSERRDFYNLFGACSFAILEIEQPSESRSTGAGHDWSPTLYIRLIEKMSQAAGGGLDWIQQACAAVRETATAQSATWKDVRTPRERSALETRFDGLVRVLDNLARTSEWVVLWDLEETLSVLANTNFDITFHNIRRWVEEGEGLQPIFGMRALLRLNALRPDSVLDLLLQVSRRKRFQEDFWLARTLIATARALADIGQGSTLSMDDREKIRKMIKSFAEGSPAPAIRGAALAALPFVSASRFLPEVTELSGREIWPWALWNLAFELQFWKREEDNEWLWNLLEKLSGCDHSHVRYAVDCALEGLKLTAPPGRAAAISRLLLGNRWQKKSSRGMVFAHSEIGIVYSPAYLEPAYDNHVECRERLQVIIDKLERVATGLFVWVDPRMATSDDIRLAHKPETDQHRDRSEWAHYLEDVVQAGRTLIEHATSSNLRSGPSELRFESYEAALLSAGGVMCAVDYVLNGGSLTAWAINRPPGHLANNTICIFNNVAIAALHARKVYNKRRFFILDFDAHHGSHTYRVFRKDPETIYFSIHQEGNYAAESGLARHTGEGLGEGFTFNVNYPGSMGDAGYAFIVEQLLEPLLRDWRPEIIFLSAGFDGHFDDPLTKGNLTEHAYIHLAERIRAVALDLGVKVVATLEGGYGLEGMTNSVLHMLRVLGDWPVAPDVIGFTERPARLAGGEDPSALSRIEEVVHERVAMMAELKARNPDYPFDLEQPHWRRLLD